MDSELFSSAEDPAGYTPPPPPPIPPTKKKGTIIEKNSKRAGDDGKRKKAGASLPFFPLPIVPRALSFYPLPSLPTTRRARRRREPVSYVLLYTGPNFFI